MKKPEWHNERRKVKDLIPSDKNPNVNTDMQFNNLKKSLKRSGYAEIIVTDIDGRIAAGNHRWKAMMEMGMADKEIDVRVPNRKLSKEEFDRYLVASNALRGEWDYDVLRTFDTGLLLDIGLHEDDLANIWDDALETEDDNFDAEKEIQKIKKADIKLGQIFQLGPHKLLCADSTNTNAIKAFLGKTRVDVINNDVPYNIGLSYDSGIGGKQNYGGRTNDKKTDKEYGVFLKRIIDNSLAVAKENCHIFIWCDEKYIGMLQELYKESDVEQKRLCMWIKDSFNPTPAIAFNKATEFCLYGARGKPYLSNRVRNLNEILNKELGTGNRLADDVWDLFNIWFAKRIAGIAYQHPTQKPPTLYEKSLRRCTKPGDVILDLTAGSGTVMVASEQLKRTAYLVEIEPIFCQLIINRYEKLTGQKAKRLN